MCACVVFHSSVCEERYRLGAFLNAIKQKGAKQIQDCVAVEYRRLKHTLGGRAHLKIDIHLCDGIR